MDSALVVDRLQFAFTITFHYLFPQLTMGLALLIVVLQTMALRTGDERYTQRGAILGHDLRHQLRHRRRDRHPDGIPVRDQLVAVLRDIPAASSVRRSPWKACSPSSWSRRFSDLFLYGEKRLGRARHWASAVAVWLGSWLSGYLHCRHQRLDAASGGLRDRPERRGATHQLLGPDPEPVGDLGIPALRWCGAVQTGAVRRWPPSVRSMSFPNARAEYAKLFLKVAVPVGCVAAVLQLYPTGDRQGLLVAQHQPATLAAMEALFTSGAGAPAGDRRSARTWLTSGWTTRSWSPAC